MDIKATVVGAIFGAGVCGTAWWLTGRNRQPSPPPVISSETSAASRSSGQSPTAVLQRDSGLEATAPTPITQEPNPEVSPYPPDSEISTSNEARAKRWKEERDLNWSYGTEQALRQYLAANKSAFKFDVVLVECRTSFCEIQASGYTDDAWPSWLLMTHDVTNQPWSEFESTGDSGGQRDGRPFFIATFFRRQPSLEAPAP